MDSVLCSISDSWGVYTCNLHQFAHHKPSCLGLSLFCSCPLYCFGRISVGLLFWCQCVCQCVCVCMCVFINVHFFMSVHTSVYVCVCVCSDIYVYMCVCHCHCVSECVLQIISKSHGPIFTILGAQRSAIYIYTYMYIFKLSKTMI